MKTNFANKVNQIIKEEAKNIIIMFEAPNKKETFETWALKKLKQDYSNSIPASINANNVIDFLSGSKFKLSPEEFEARKTINTSYASLLNQFKMRNKVKADDFEDFNTRGMNDDEGEENEPSAKGKIYRSGEMPLDDIARELGDITKMGVSKKIDDALGKLMRLGVDRDGENNLTNKIDSARREAADEYTTLLLASKGNVNAFLKALEAAKLTRLALDVGEVSNTEKQALKSLYDSMKSHGNDKELGMEMLISDLEDNDPSERVWQTFQAVVARKANPRKKKNNEED